MPNVIPAWTNPNSIIRMSLGTAEQFISHLELTFSLFIWQKRRNKRLGHVFDDLTLHILQTRSLHPTHMHLNYVEGLTWHVTSVNILLLRLQSYRKLQTNLSFDHYHVTLKYVNLKHRNRSTSSRVLIDSGRLTQYWVQNSKWCIVLNMHGTTNW
jgi:uncharacterized protein YigA (DUF484 family)